MEKRKFMGYKIAISAALYMFAMGGLSATFSVVYAFLPEHFNVSLTQLAAGGSVGVFSAMIFGMFASIVIDKLGARLCMFLGAVIMFAYSMFTAYMRSFWGVVCSFLCIGAMLAFANQGTVTALLIPWFIEKRATIISTCVAANMFGIFIYQLIGGQIVEKFGLTKLYIIFGGVTCAVLAVCSLLVRNRPEEVGQTALGAENAKKGAETSADKNTECVSKKVLYKNPVFWLMVIASILVGSAVSQTGTYMTIYFPQYGMQYGTAAMLVSLCGLASGFCTMANGRIMEKLGIRKFIFLLMSGAVICNLLTAFYSKNQSLLVIIFIVLFYSLGFSAAYITNILVTPLFGEALSTEANTKLLAIMQGGNALIVPIYAKLFETFSFSSVYLIIAGVNCVTIILYALAMHFAKKKGVQV